MITLTFELELFKTVPQTSTFILSNFSAARAQMTSGQSLAEEGGSNLGHHPQQEVKHQKKKAGSSGPTHPSQNTGRILPVSPPTNEDSAPQWKG